ncbi:hypothetical protein QL285_008757 [Trifolium repens]|nr:hypothetical protein QL285_008757 [Trifolium repens]
MSGAALRTTMVQSGAGVRTWCFRSVLLVLRRRLEMLSVCLCVLVLGGSLFPTWLYDGWWLLGELRFLWWLLAELRFLWWLLAELRFYGSCWRSFFSGFYQRRR